MSNRRTRRTIEPIPADAREFARGWYALAPGRRLFRRIQNQGTWEGRRIKNYRGWATLHYEGRRVKIHLDDMERVLFR